MYKMFKCYLHNIYFFTQKYIRTLINGTIGENVCVRTTGYFDNIKGKSIRLVELNDLRPIRLVLHT